MLVVPGDTHVVTKKSLDGFLDTDLDFVLRRVYGAETVILAGINTDTCVYSTAFSASNRGYQTVVISDCVASMRGKDHHWMALELMARSIAWVLTLEELRAKLRVA
jgi:nicotinamidase-related amidase